MTTFNNTTKANNLYPVANAVTSSNPFVFEFQGRDPTTNDINFPIQKFWLNTVNNNIWFLKNYNSSTGVVYANWIFLGNGTASIETITGDDGIVIDPVLNNINAIGNAVANATHAKPVFFRSGGNPNLELDVQVSTASAGSNINKAGISSFNNTEFTVDANGFVSLIGGSAAIDSVQVDAFTAPGTNPVLPTGAGLIIVTGGQVAAGTTANVIRTDSLAANTYTIEVQRSQAVASSTVGDNGVSHFNSAQFTVDGNGFVSLVGGGPYISLTPFIVGTDIHSGFNTIASAITAAVTAGATSSTPMNVYIKAKVDGTPYSENLTLQPGVNLIGFGQTVTISGKMTFTQAGTVNIQGLKLQTNSDFLLAVTGIANSIVNLDDCYLNCTNNTGISFTTSGASSQIFLKGCQGNLATTGIAIFSHSSAGTLFFSSCDFTNTGASSTANTASSGSLGIRRSAFENPLTTSGTVTCTSIFSQWDSQSTNSTCLTLGSASSQVFHYTNLTSGTASALSISTSAVFTHLTAGSSNVNAITGAGAIQYAFIAFTSSSGINIVTQTPLATLI